MLHVGIDPSIQGTGIVILENDNPQPIIAEKCLVDDAKRGLSSCMRIAQALKQTIYQQRLPRGLGTPVRVAVEHYSYGSQFNVVDLVQLGTAIRIMLVRAEYAYLDPSPGQVKKFAGMPKARWKKKPKAEVLALWGYKAKNGDVADAYVLAQIARAASCNVPGLTDAQREVLMSCRHGLALAA